MVLHIVNTLHSQYGDVKDKELLSQCIPTGAWKEREKRLTSYSGILQTLSESTSGIIAALLNVGNVSAIGDDDGAIEKLKNSRRRKTAVTDEEISKLWYGCRQTVQRDLCKHSLDTYYKNVIDVAVTQLSDAMDNSNIADLQSPEDSLVARLDYCMDNPSLSIMIKMIATLLRASNYESKSQFHNFMQQDHNFVEDCSKLFSNTRYLAKCWMEKPSSTSSILAALRFNNNTTVANKKTPPKPKAPGLGRYHGGWGGRKPTSSKNRTSTPSMQRIPQEHKQKLTSLIKTKPHAIEPPRKAELKKVTATMKDGDLNLLIESVGSHWKNLLNDAVKSVISAHLGISWNLMHYFPALATTVSFFIRFFMDYCDEPNLHKFHEGETFDTILQSELQAHNDNRPAHLLVHQIYHADDEDMGKCERLIIYFTIINC